MRTKYVNEQGEADIVNRFGLETENSGKVQLNLNICFQHAMTKKETRKKVTLKKEGIQLETKRQVMKYKLEIKEKLEAEKRVKMQQ